MLQIAIIGLGAGAAAALLFASVASGALLSVLLFYLAPLPIMIAVLGWSHLAGLIAAASAALALALVFGTTFFFAFLFGVGLPAWWLGYLTLLARPATHGDQSVLDWYPPGRLVLWAAILGALVVIVAIPTFGTDEESFRAGLRSAFERVIRVQSGTPTGATTGDSVSVSGLDTGRLIDFMVIVIPPTAAVLATMTNLINLWIAGRVVRASGRLHRPWPDLPDMTFPPLAAAALLGALIVALFGSLVGIAATVLASSLLMAFGVLGFAVMHAVTRGMPSRTFVLAGTYAASVVFGWPVVAMTFLGLADMAFGLRARVARKRGPPART